MTEPTSSADLAPTFTRVAQELHSQYVLGFAPATDGKLHKLEVRVASAGAIVRARKSFLARPPAS
jgi:hypothetical protein